MIRANGEPLEVLFRVARSPRWGEDWMMLPFPVDITERKRIERELVHRCGAVTLAQDESTSGVFGMPGAAIASGAVHFVHPLPSIAPAILGHG